MSDFKVVQGDKPEPTDRAPLVDDSTLRLTPENIDDLRKRKILRDAEQEIELPPFGPGQEKIGVLNAEERTIFCELAVLDAGLYEWGKEITARSHEKIASAVRSSDSAEQAADKLAKDILFTDDAEAEEYFGEIYRRDLLNATFWWNVRARLGLFGANLDICHGFAIAKSGYKYKVAEGIK